MIEVQIDMLSPKIELLKESVGECECRFLVFTTEGGDVVRFRFTDLESTLDHHKKIGHVLGIGVHK